MQLHHQRLTVVIGGDGLDVTALPQLRHGRLHFLQLLGPHQLRGQLRLLLLGAVPVGGHLIVDGLKNELIVAQGHHQHDQDQQHDLFPACQLPVHSSTSLHSVMLTEKLRIEAGCSFSVSAMFNSTFSTMGLSPIFWNIWEIWSRLMPDMATTA